MLEAILGYISKGYSVIPFYSRLETGDCACGNPKCPSVGLHPCAPKGWADAPDMTDEQAKTVWKRLPGASVGLRMGRGHAYVRVAAGTPEPPTYPPTLAWRSRDATFYIFAGNDRGRNIRAGVQFRCGGSAVLAPPNAQLTMINDAPSAQLPRWWDL